jgi:hypothetical protein
MGREGAVDVDTQDPRVLAHMKIPAAALVAVTTDDVRLDGDAGSGRRALDALSPGHDLTADLVSDHARRTHARRRP